MINLGKLLELKGMPLEPANTKIHLAIPIGSDVPLKIFFEGHFKAWQEEQSLKNFQKDYILSLIRMSPNDVWLFVGVYRVKGVQAGTNTRYLYNTELLPDQDDMIGRIVVNFHRPSRQSYLLGENYFECLNVVEILRQKLTIEEFPGFDNIILDKKTLNLIINNEVKSWTSALSSVGGIYLIVDTKTGKMYIGSAYGEGGIWQRWSSYAANSHGGNLDLKKVLSENGDNYANNFQYSILEIADTHTTVEKLIEREIYWKKVLLTRQFGYNLN